MKRLLLILFIATSLASCKKDEKIPEPNYSIIGKWWLKQSILTAPDANGYPEKTYINRDHTDFLLFNSDYTGSEEYTLWQKPTVSKTYTYSKTDNNITLTYPDGTKSTWDIKNIDNSTLVLSQPRHDFRGTLGVIEITYIK